MHSFARSPAILAPILVTAVAGLRAQDPPPPAGGFPILTVLDQLVTWSDGYRTRVDVRYPSVAPGANGWPGVAVIHGGGTSRKTGSVRDTAINLAKYGYCTFAYDVRGQGDTVALNPNAPLRFPGAVELRDSAEIYFVVENALGPTLDTNRLAMTGRSQGGTHSRRAAAYSGRPLPLAGFVNSFPVVRAVAFQNTGLDDLEDRIPGGNTITSNFVDGIGQDQTSPLWAAALAGRFDLVRAALAADPVVHLLPGIQSNDVPCWAQMTFNDTHHFPSATLDALQTLNPGVPVKGLVSAGIHGAPNNDVEDLLIESEIRRWFDRFLKGAANGTLQEPRFEAAVMPFLPADYLSATSHWQHRFAPVWPPATAPTTLYLRGNGTLAGAPPAGAEPSPAIAHRVPAAYDLTAYWNDGAGFAPNVVFLSVPKISREFVSPPLTEDAELLGRPVFSAVVQALQGDFQFSAALLARDPNGVERYLCGGTGAVRGQAPGSFPVTFALRDVAMIVPAGMRFVVRIENVDHMRPPGNETLFVAPLLQSYDIQVPIAPGTPPRIELPIVATRGVGLTPRLAKVTAAGGFAHPVTVDAGAARAGQVYVLLLSASGYGPGFAVGGTTVPLNIDPFTSFALGLANTPNFAAFAGQLGAPGRATATLALPPAIAPVTAGLQFTIAGVVLGPAWVGFGPAQFEVLP